MASLLLARCWPPRKGRPISFAMPRITTPPGAIAALDAIATAIGDGLISIEEGQGLADIVERTRRAIELVEVEARLRKIEERMG